MTLLSVRALTKIFRGDKKTPPRVAVSDLDFDLREGEILAFLGPNGAGKTTTIKMIAALIRPDSGHVLVNGRDIHKELKGLEIVGAVLEGSRNLYWRLTPIENIEYFAGVRGIPRRRARAEGEMYLTRFGLQDRRDSPVSKLSRGMQQKVAIITALIHRPRLLLLDEPTLGLDLQSANEMKLIIGQLVEQGIGVLLTTHQLSLAEAIADNVLILCDGKKVLHSSMREALRDSHCRNHTIILADNLTEEKRHCLVELGAQVANSTVNFSGDSTALYDVVSALRPLNIDEIRTSARSLDDVFLEIAHNGHKATTSR